MSTVMGWTASQWAEAKGYYDLCKQPPVARDFSGLRTVRNWWYRRWPQMPGESLIIGAEHPMDFMWSYDAIDSVMKETARLRL